MRGADYGQALVGYLPPGSIVDRVAFYVNAVSTPGAAIVTVEGVVPPGTGLMGSPDGDPIASAIVDVDADAAGTWVEAPVGPVTVPAAGPIAIAVQWSSGNFSLRRSGGEPIRGVPWWGATRSGGAWSAATSTSPLVVFRVDGKWTGSGAALPADVSSETFSDHDEVGTRFTVPFRCRVSGVYHGRSGSTSAASELRLYGPGGELLAAEPYSGPRGSGSYGVIGTRFPVPVELEPGTEVRVTCREVDAGVVLTVQQVPFPELLPGDAVYTRRTDGGPWEDVPGRAVLMGLLLSGLG